VPVLVCQVGHKQRTHSRQAHQRAPADARQHLCCREAPTHALSVSVTASSNTSRHEHAAATRTVGDATRCSSLLLSSLSSSPSSSPATPLLVLTWRATCPAAVVA
jgi:hypothetical protein